MSLLEQLNNPDPAQRRKAIVAIANSKDPAMLKPLGALYRNDPDPQVRELALKAGKYIQGAQQAAAYEPPPPPPPSAPGLDPNNPYSRPYTPNSGAYSPPGGGGPSASFFTAAPAGTGASSGGYDPGVGNMFGAYSGTPAAMSIPQTPLVRGEKMVTIIDILIDLALYAVIIAVSLTAFLIVGSKVFFKEFKDDLFKDSQTSTTQTEVIQNSDGSTTTFTYEDPYASSTTPQIFTEAEYENLMDISVVGSLIAGLMIGLSSCITIVFDCVGIHIAATSILGGKGGMVDFMHRYIPFMTYTILIVTIVAVAGLVLMTVSVDFGTILLMTLAAGSLVWTFWSMWLVGRSYELGSAYGCIAIFIGLILAGVISAMFNCMFSSVSALPF